MPKGKKELRTYDFKEFKKEFYSPKSDSESRKKDALHELGVKMARESLGEIRKTSAD